MLSAVEDLDAQWLSEVLHNHGALPATEDIRSVSLEGLGQQGGFLGSVFRARLAGNESGPRTVIVKLAHRKSHGTAWELGLYANELAFYRHVAPFTPLRTPQVYFAGESDDTECSVLVLEDLSHLECGDQEAGLTLERARLAVEELACFHASFSGGEQADEMAAHFGSIDAPPIRQLYPRLFEEGWNIYLEVAPVAPTGDTRALADGFGELLPWFVESLAERPVLAHGDFRADNLFFSPGQVAAIDFQFVRRMCGIADVAYLISQSLTETVRRGTDEAFVRHYLGRLSVAGHNDWSWSEAFCRYRIAVAFYLAHPVMAIRGWDSLGSRQRNLVTALIDRALAAIRDIDALSVLPR